MGWCVLTRCRVVRDFFGMHSRWGIRRRQGWVVLTRYCVVRRELDSEHGGVYDLVCVDPVVVLVVALGGGLNVFTRCCLDLSCYSLTVPCSVLPRLIIFHTCSFPLFSSIVLVVFAWLGQRCWVWVDREGWWWWLRMYSRCDDVTIKRRWA